MVSSVIQPRILPKVMIDARMVGEVPHGIARYVTQIAKGLKLQSQSHPLKYEPVFLVNKAVNASLFQSFQTFELNCEFLNPKELIEIPKILKDLKIDAYHSPSFASLWKSPCPTAVTIHDLNHLTYGSISKKLYYRLLLRRFAIHSKMILTVSEFSRDEISRWLKLPQEKIQVIYNAMSAQNNAPSASEVSKILDQYGLQPREYFFCVSNSKSHKNLSLLVQSYQNFRNQHQKAWPFVITVRDFSQVQGVHSVGGLSDSETAILLKNASALFFPSIYEGFGLPPLEAAIAGVPLAVSDIPPHREGLIDLEPGEALWLAPSDFHGWVNAFHKIARGETKAPSEATGLKILNRFSLLKMGQSIDQVYQHMIGFAQ